MSTNIRNKPKRIVLGEGYIAKLLLWEDRRIKTKSVKLNIKEAFPHKIRLIAEILE